MRHLILVIVLFLTGCSTVYRPIRTDQDLTGMNLHLKEDGESLKKSAAVIDEKSASIEVKKEAARVTVVAERLITEKDPIAKKMKTYAEDLEQQVVKFKNDKTKRLDNFFFGGLFLGGVLVLGAIAVWVLSNMSGAFSGNAMALQLGISGIIVMVLSGACYLYFTPAVTIIGIILLILLISCILKVYNAGKPLAEAAQTINDLKSTADETGRGIADRGLSEATKNLFDGILRRQAAKAAKAAAKTAVSTAAAEAATDAEPTRT